MPLSRRRLLLGSAGLALTGCGGGSDPTIDPNFTSRVRPSLSIRWGVSGRALDAPSTANTAEIIVRSLRSAAETTTLEVSRHPVLGTQEPVDTYELPFAIPVGPVELSVRFYYTPSYPSDRTLVASVLARVELSGPSGALPDVDVESRVVQVTVPTGQTVPVGARTNLAFTALDAQGNLVPLGAEVASFEILTGEGTALAAVSGVSTAKQGRFEGIAPGVATVRVRVGELVSLPVGVQVTNFATIAPGVRMGFLSASEVLWDTSRKRLWVVDSATTGSNTLLALDPLTATITRRITVPGGGLSQLQLAVDGSGVFGFVLGAKAVLRVSLDEGVVVERIAITSQGDVPPSLATVPGKPDTLIITAGRPGSFYNDDAWVYDGKVPRPVSFRAVLAAAGMLPDGPTFYSLSVSTNDEGTLAYLSNGASGWRVGIGPQGFVEGSVVSSPMGRFYHGQLLDTTGRVFDAASGVLLATLVSFNQGQVALSQSVPAYLVAARNPSGSAMLQVLSTTNFAELGSMPLPERLPSFQDFATWESAIYNFYLSYYLRQVANWGSHGAVVLRHSGNGGTQVLLFDTVPGL